MGDHSQLRTQLQERLRELTERTMEIENSVSAASNPDLEDNAIESEDDDVLMKIGSLTEQEIRDIRISIERIDSGVYGTCIECQRKISQERLEALPFATTCINCA